MGALLGKHELMVLGATHNLTPSGTTQRYTLSANPSNVSVFLIYAVGQAVYLKQGDNTVEATASSFELKAGGYMKIVVTKTSNAYLAYLQKDTAGTVKITRLDSEDPGADT